MRNAYIVKKSVKRNPLKPKELVKYEEFKNLVENSENLIWTENTKHGKRWHERYPNRKKKTTAYINIDETDEKSYVQLYHSISGFITIQFDYKSTKENLHDLIRLAEKIDCNLWQYSPKRQILTHEIVKNRHKRKKPRAKIQAELNPITNWIYCEGSLEDFQKFNQIKLNKIKTTISRINNGISKNSIAVFEIEKEIFFIVGEGIDNLFDTEMKLGDDDDYDTLKSKFHKRISKLFKKVVFRDSAGEEKKIKIESEIVTHLRSLIENKEEIYITKISKKLF